jgi:hypothetical protein
MEAPFVFGDGVEELLGPFQQAGFNSSRIRSDARMVRFASADALVQYKVAGSPLT